MLGNADSVLKREDPGRLEEGRTMAKMAMAIVDLPIALVQLWAILGCAVSLCHALRMFPSGSLSEAARHW